MAVVAVELVAISGIRARYMATPFWRATLQVVGGVLVPAGGRVDRERLIGRA